MEVHTLAKNVYEIKLFPVMWQSYIIAILDSLQIRKFCGLIIDDLVLFTPTKKSHMAKLEDLLKALLKMD